MPDDGGGRPAPQPSWFLVLTMATPTAHTAPAHTATAPGRVLITGLGGFTGRYVQTALEQRGWEVWGLGAQPAPADLGIAPQHYLQADLMDSAALAHAVAQATLGWAPQTTLEQLCQMMVEADLRRNRAGFSF